MIVNDKTQKETAYKLENIIEKVQEGGTGEEIEEESGEFEAEEPEGDDEEEEELYEPPAAEDEKEYVGRSS